jgi:hypothetical protein
MLAIQYVIVVRRNGKKINFGSLKRNYNLDTSYQIRNLLPKIVLPNSTGELIKLIKLSILSILNLIFYLNKLYSSFLDRKL